MKKIVILYSGGLDSYIMGLLARVKDPTAEIEKVYYDIGQDYAWKEIDALPKDVQVCDFSDWDASAESKNTASGSIFIPGRNATLANLAASMFVPDEIWLGALQGEIHSKATDKNETFLEKINDMLAYVYSPYERQPVVKFPLAEEGFNKLTAVEWALSVGSTPAELIHTSSCLTGSTDIPCGECVVCARRWGIFSQLGFAEEYEVDPYTSPKNKKMFDDMMQGEDSYYDQDRRDEIVPVLLRRGYGK